MSTQVTVVELLGASPEDLNLVYCETIILPGRVMAVVVPFDDEEPLVGCVRVLAGTPQRFGAMLHGCDCELSRSVAIPFALGHDVTLLAPCSAIASGDPLEEWEFPL